MRMFQIMDRLRRAWSEFHPSTDLNKSQLGTLLILRHGTEKPCAPAQQAQHKPMTMSELAARMGQSMPAVSQRISKRRWAMSGARATPGTGAPPGST